MYNGECTVQVISRVTLLPTTRNTKIPITTWRFNIKILYTRNIR